ncbi:MAG TPA: response regulator [Candidatus Sumerlaeota bacterium]|nr:response regulator [Candidatus Sumerlaeota bacterium]HPS01862.1 response regulator [Candidatus Sumerlaeota bacterium]
MEERGKTKDTEIGIPVGAGRILLADDEEVFLHSTADLLREAGFECDCAPDGPTAIRLLTEQAYDLFICDIRMPGNSGLDLIGDLPESAQGLPVILVTGYPSVDTAVQSLKLPVTAYLTKPLDFERLLEQVRPLIGVRHAQRVVRQLRDHMRNWAQDLDCFEKMFTLSCHRMPTQHPGTTGPSPSDPRQNLALFVDLTVQNLMKALLSVRDLVEGLTREQQREHCCTHMNCPRLDLLGDVLAETVQVLENTREEFKSKSIGDLRKKLEQIIGN